MGWLGRLEESEKARDDALARASLAQVRDHISSSSSLLLSSLELSDTAIYEPRKESIKEESIKERPLHINVLW